MHLLGNGERHARKSQRVCRFSVSRPQTGKRRLPIRDDVDAWAALNESRPKKGNGIKGRKELRRARALAL